MAFSGRTFVFDNVPSETYNLFLSNTDGGDVSISSGSDVELFTGEVYRRPKPYFYGSRQTPVLSFPLFISSPTEIESSVGGRISSWLFGQREYKKLQIYQDDMLDVYFNCFLTGQQTKRIGNKIQGYDFTVVCDAPWAWEFTKSKTYDYTAELVDDDIVFTNKSDNSDYLYPSLVITMNSFGGDVTITNSSDANRVFEITSLTAGEIITVDNDRGMLTSSLDLRRLGSFNKLWFRMPQGRNEFNISGNVESVVMSYDFARKVT